MIEQKLDRVIELLEILVASRGVELPAAAVDIPTLKDAKTAQDLVALVQKQVAAGKRAQVVECLKAFGAARASEVKDVAGCHAAMEAL